MKLDEDPNPDTQKAGIFFLINKAEYKTQENKKTKMSHKDKNKVAT